MNEVHQLASALLTIVFAAVMFVVGHLYIENRSTRIPVIPAAQAFMPWTNPLQKTSLGETVGLIDPRPDAPRHRPRSPFFPQPDHVHG
jgi:hypothetical protein